MPPRRVSRQDLLDIREAAWRIRLRNASLVAEADLRPELWDTAGIQPDQNDGSAWGKAFIYALERLGMSAFPELPSTMVGLVLPGTTAAAGNGLADEQAGAG
jgi:hypothetical protein